MVIQVLLELPGAVSGVPVHLPDIGHRPCFRDRCAPTGRVLFKPRIAERINVTVSIVATASYNGVESNTRR